MQEGCSKRILEAGKKAGLSVNFHAEELNRTGGAEMGAAIKVGDGTQTKFSGFSGIF